MRTTYAQLARECCRTGGLYDDLFCCYAILCPDHVLCVHYGVRSVRLGFDRVALGRRMYLQIISIPVYSCTTREGGHKIKCFVLDCNRTWRKGWVPAHTQTLSLQNHTHNTYIQHKHIFITYGLCFQTQNCKTSQPLILENIFNTYAFINHPETWIHSKVSKPQCLLFSNKAPAKVYKCIS